MNANAERQINHAVQKVILFSDKARKQGLLSLIPLLGNDVMNGRDHIFEYGVALACNGCDCEHTRSVLRNIIKNKKYGWSADLKKNVDMLFVTGVLGIQSGESTNVLIQKIDSNLPEKFRTRWLKSRIAENLESLAKSCPRVYLRPEDVGSDFDKIATLSDSQIQKLLQELSTETIMWAVRDNDKVQNVFCHNMSNKAAAMLIEDIGFIRERRTAECQREIIAKAQRLGFI